MCDQPSASRYTHGCRCQACRAAWAAHQREYRAEHPSRKRVEACEWCGKAGTTTGTGRFCSKGCVARYATSCIPPGKPKPVRRPRPAPKPRASRVYFPECAWCGESFCTRKSRAALCSEHCSRRAKKVRRAGRENAAYGTYSWVEVIGVFLAFDRCCAYCRRPVVGQPDPDHVVPLSRGGANTITNILPSCRLCNSDKRDLLLDEWAADRKRRGLEPRVTSWTVDDPLYVHLTSVLPVAA